ncbi:cation channel family transporter [Cystoisospora suis]|uniref:Cation channel family transporter n=1 Tax=Cystoisospora suis TaxID=483139 RepID=A0A2C6L431_9APIC|nr:cation channel family transporter [Cystoisospora suis]
MSTSGSEGGEEGGAFFSGQSSVHRGEDRQQQPERRGTGRSGTGERKPLLPEAQRRRSKLLLSLQSDIGKGFVFAVRLSRWYLLYCTLMALATLGLVVYMIVDVHVRGNTMPIWAVALDGAITLTLCIETALDIYFIGRAFWGSGWHVFDFAVALTSFISWLLLLLEVTGVIKDFDQYVTIILLTCRYTAQTIRIIRYIRTGAQAQDVQTTIEEQPVIFDPHVASTSSRHFREDLERGDQYVRVGDAM